MGMERKKKNYPAVLWIAGLILLGVGFAIYISRGFYEESRDRIQNNIHIGCVSVMGSYMYFNQEGIVTESKAEREEDVPVITGLEFQEIALNRKLVIPKESLYDTILQLTLLIKKNELTVDEIWFDPDSAVTLRVGKITVLLGKRKLYDEPLDALPEILEVLGDKSGTLDMRNYSLENTDATFSN